MDIRSRKPLRRAPSMPFAEDRNISSDSSDAGKPRQTDETLPDLPGSLHSSQEFLNQESRKENGFQKTVKPLYTPESAAPLSSGSSSLILTCGVFVAFAIIAACAFASGYFSNTGIKTCSFSALSQRNPTQEDSVWIHLKVGIENILNGRSRTTGVYLFVHHGGEHVLGLVREIAKESSSCFGRNRQPIEIEKDDFLSTDEDDYGPAIEKFKAKIKEGKVILIANLNEIPAKRARALHAICDTHSPIAKDIVIFLTLVVEGAAREISLQKTLDTLYEMWAPELGNNEIDALITRVTDQVIVLH